MNRWLATGIRTALALGLAVTAAYYALLASGRVGGVTLLMPGPIGALLKIHDALSLLIMIYWLFLVIRFPRLHRPIVPLAVFFMHAVAEPFLLLGVRGAGFFHTGRFAAFYIGYPLALVALGLWLAHWLLAARRNPQPRA